MRCLCDPPHSRFQFVKAQQVASDQLSEELLDMPDVEPLCIKPAGRIFTGGNSAVCGFSLLLLTCNLQFCPYPLLLGVTAIADSGTVRGPSISWILFWIIWTPLALGRTHPVEHA